MLSRDIKLELEDSLRCRRDRFESISEPHRYVFSDPPWIAKQIALGRALVLTTMTLHRFLRLQTLESNQGMEIWREGRRETVEIEGVVNIGVVGFTRIGQGEFSERSVGPYSSFDLDHVFESIWFGTEMSFLVLEFSFREGWDLNFFYVMIVSGWNGIQKRRLSNYALGSAKRTWSFLFLQYGLNLIMIKDVLDYGDAFAECDEVGVFGVQNNHSLSGCTSGTVEP
ncbi:hypothetical protein POM88_038597 [Heracleum sosnowskyi]|uniref:Uncharacterized protein n=1 Tax=Heracleum sosnowskyi TaxID=360622 RepID=A0AAD8H9W1_9APIA|nr:hypothetical protein POM88_038597 [Heracleum sosnowskyi]